MPIGIGTSPADGEQQLKRSRPVLSCLECRRKKLKCNRLLPCLQCRKCGRASQCSFHDGVEPVARSSEITEYVLATERPTKRIRIDPALPLDSVHEDGERDERVREDDLNDSVPGRGLLEDLQDRVRRLEHMLLVADDHGGSTSGTASDARAQPGEVTRHYQESGSSSELRYHAHKERLTFLSPFPDASVFMNNLRNKGHGLGDLAEELEALHRSTKRRQKEKPEADFDQEMLMSMLRYLPDRTTCDELVGIYFDNYENCYRILHRPTFGHEYEDFWLSRQSGTLAPTHFLPTLLVILSIASTMGITPACKLITFELSGQRTIRELIKLWMEGLPREHRYSFAILQLKVLMFLPQRTRTSRIEDLWIETGELVRHAILMGLDREPSKPAKFTLFELEMRRKLWMTILEYDLAISLMAGKPTTLALENLGVSLPTNVNDGELAVDMKVLPPPRSQNEWTDGLCQSVLASSLALRLSAYRYVTDAAELIRYERLLQYTRQLEDVLQNLPPPLRFNHEMGEKNGNPGRLFSRIVLDTFVRRVLLNLYTPFALAMPTNDGFREARIAYTQSCLLLLCYQDIFDPKFSEVNVPIQEGYWDTFYMIYKFDVLQICLGLCLEIRRLTEASNVVTGHTDSATSISNGSTLPKNKIAPWSKATLIKTVEESIEPLVRRISRPGSDAKDLLCITIALHSARNAKQEGGRTQKAITEAVQELVAACQRQMQKDGVSIANSDAASSVGSSDGIFNIGAFDLSAFPTQFNNFHFDMAAFPDIDMLGQVADVPISNSQAQNWLSR